MKNGKFTVASLFSGIGGLDLGFEWAGFDVVWANDVVEIAVDSYAMNFGRRPVLADINELDIDSIPDTDVIVGGPPCQSFSLVGQRRPDDKRGNLVYRFVEVVTRKRPRAFVMENVPGLAASRVDERRLTDVLLERFSSLGYSVTAMKLDASRYLVPQRRRRIFLIGSLAGHIPEPDPVEFARACYSIDVHAFDLSATAAIGDLGSPVAKGEFARYKNRLQSDFSKIMRSRGNGRVSLHEMPRMSETDTRLLSFIPPGGNYMNVPDEFATQRILNFKRTGGRTTTYGRLHPNEPAYTINTYFRRPNVGAHFHYAEPRLITAREAMRFQSIPDHFVLSKSGPQDARNALIGNAVPPLLAHAVAWRVRKFLEDQNQKQGTVRRTSRSRVATCHAESSL